MRKYFMKALVCFGLLMPLIFIEMSPSSCEAQVSPKDDKSQPEKADVQKETEALKKDLERAFEDFSSVSKTLIETMTAYLGSWLDENYERLNKKNREKLRIFLKKLQDKYGELESMSVQNLREMLEELKAFFEDIEKEFPQKDGPPEQEDRKYI